VEKVFAWYLISLYTGGSGLFYSPPMVTEQDCRNLQTAMKWVYIKSECVQLNVYLVKNK